MAFMKYWAGLHSTTDAFQLQQGADALLNLALGAGARRNAAGNTRLIVPRMILRSMGTLTIQNIWKSKKSGVVFASRITARDVGSRDMSTKNNLASFCIYPVNKNSPLSSVR
jgi:hypothetical protein